MFINLTNHPSEKWSSEQSSAAHEQYGEIMDISFPDIPPEWSSEQVANLADDYFEQIKSLLPMPTTSDAVHLMGEQTFCCKLVCLLTDAGYTVVASTTRRINKLLPNGNIEKSFIFVKFRKY